MPNYRMFYPHAGATITPIGLTSFGATHVIHGLQDVGISTNFNLERIFEIGQATEYEAIEEVPDVSVDLTKVMDGYCPMYLLATNGATSSTLEGRADKQCTFSLFVYPMEHASASGTPLRQVDVSGCFINSVSYTAAVEENCTETMNLVSNDKVWKSSAFNFSGDMFDNTDVPLAITGSGGINRREDVIFSPVSGGTVLPPDIAGISSSGSNNQTNGVFGASIQRLSVNADFGREGLKELGRKRDYYKFRQPVTTVNTEVEVIAKTGDLVDARGDTDNLTNRTIFIKLREGLQLDLGTKNKLESSSMTGLSAGGGNATVTYTFGNANFLTVQHPMDITTALRP